jgi:quercetin dioxygenase-like cupin family protein
MDLNRIRFAEIEWVSPLPGIRFKAFRSGETQLRLVEFSQEFVEPNWCEKEHAGYVLEGVLEIDFHGRKETFEAGDGLFISAGPGCGHKARALTPVVRVILFEE